MIQEAYCSFEVAKLLKEKGFNVPTHAFYNPKKSYAFKFDTCLIDRNAGIYVSAPTHQMAIAWLREKDIRICPDYSDVDGKWFAMIGTKKKRTYSGYYNSYEQAIEVALKYVLENLI